MYSENMGFKKLTQSQVYPRQSNESFDMWMLFKRTSQLLFSIPNQVDCYIALSQLNFPPPIIEFAMLGCLYCYFHSIPNISFMIEQIFKQGFGQAVIFSIFRKIKSEMIMRDDIIFRMLQYSVSFVKKPLIFGIQSDLRVTRFKFCSIC